MHCENCGSEIKAGNQFCENCGTKAAGATGERKSFNFKLLLIILASLIVIGGAFAYFGDFFKSKEDITTTSKIRVEQLITSPAPTVQSKQAQTECNSDSNCADDKWCLSGKCSNLGCPEGTVAKNHDCITETKLTCGLKVSLKVAEIDQVPQICYGGSADSGYIEIRLNNEDETNDIAGLSVSVSGETGTYNNDLSLTIPVGTSTGVRFSYSYTTYGKIKSIRIVPKILVRGQVTPCGGSPLEKSASEMRKCST